MPGGVVAIVSWRRGARRAENRRLLELAAAAGRVRPKGWRSAMRRWRSLVLHADGTVELGMSTVGAAARRSGARAVQEGSEA